MEEKNLRENMVHGSTAYPFAVYEFKGGTDGQVDLHWHKENEIIYLEQGRFFLSINMKEYHVDAPALIFLGAGDIHSIRLHKTCLESAVVFDFSMLSFENYDGVQLKIIRPLIEKRLCFPQLIVPQNQVWNRVHSLYECLRKEGNQKSLSAYLKMKASLYELIACLYEYDCLQDIKEVDDNDTDKIDVMKRVITYISNCYAQKLTVEEIAHIAGMNPQYFCRYFKKITGKTVTEYVNDVRLKQAEKALFDTDEKIIRIAGNCGYDNMGYFIKRFRQNFGMTPSEYRKSKKVKIV